MAQQLRTFITFQGGQAAAALEHYSAVFNDFELVQVDRYRGDDGGPQGTVKHAVFRLAGNVLSCADSPIDHAWGITPAISLWIDCDTADEQQRLFDRLGEGGQVFMPLGGYGFSTRFGWVGDRHDVTWQLNLP